MTAELISPQSARKVTPDFTNSLFMYSREFWGNRYVYTILSPRARGLSIGVNMNLDKRCNFDCAYCFVNRAVPMPEQSLDVDVLRQELEWTLWLTHSEQQLRKLNSYRNVPANLLQLRQVALSGDGEPTLCPNFVDVVHTIVHVRALGEFPFFKIVLLTNASALNLENVQEGLKLFTPQDEIWAKLDAGTQRYMDEVNRPDCLLEKILENILLVARKRPVIIQSFFSLLNHEEPGAEEIGQYALRLRDLKNCGAQIPLVQIYSATCLPAKNRCGHLPLKTLSSIARRVREVTGLKVEVF